MDPSTQACASLNQKLTQLSRAQSECTIYRVHRHLRNVKPKAYEPEIIAIGPYHRHKDHLKMMEDHKLRYLQLLIKNEGSINADKYALAAGELAAEARKCYADHPSSLCASEFIEMLVLDGCFIIELLRKFEAPCLREKNEPIFHMSWMTNSLQRDLMLFENQLPFFVLCELYDLIEAPRQQSRLWYLLRSFFSNLYPGQGVDAHVHGEGVVGPREVKHLLEFIHRSWLPPRPPRAPQPRERELRFINSAVRLKEANVKFVMSDKVRLFDVEFDEGVMVMAPLTIEDRTEALLRNLIAYEQYFEFEQKQGSLVTDYVKLLDCLVDSCKDVEILSRSGIVEIWLGDEEVVATMVNKLLDSVAGPGDGFVYAEMFESVNLHCRKRRNRWMANFRRNYINSPWAIISLLVALVLLLLTATQTLFTILQVV